MLTVWATVLVASLGCYGLKLAGVSLPCREDRGVATAGSASTSSRNTEVCFPFIS